jgi:hypothetical protein
VGIGVQRRGLEQDRFRTPVHARPNQNIAVRVKYEEHGRWRWQ